MDAVWPYLAAILPTILVAILFYFLIKSMLEGDRRERLAQRKFEARAGPRGGGLRPECRGFRRGCAPVRWSRARPEILRRNHRPAFSPLTSLYLSGNPLLMSFPAS